MKSLIFICVCLPLLSCSPHSYEGSLVEIVGNRAGNPIVRGMGVCISDGRVLTSAHVVPDDRDTYMIGGSSYIVSERDIVADRAYLSRGSQNGHNPCLNIREYVGKNDMQNIGDTIIIPVMRDNTIVYLTGHIRTTTGEILAYDTRGQSQVLTGMIITDISLLPGDSGSPILDRQGIVIDIVHVE